MIPGTTTAGGHVGVVRARDEAGVEATPAAGRQPLADDDPRRPR